jgi:hypothetical protein
MPELKEVHASNACKIAVFGPVLLQRWFGPVALADAESALRAHVIAREATKEQILVLAVVDGVPALPSHDVREALAKMADTTAHEVAAHATVVAAEGFAGSALRSVMTAIFSMSRTKYPRRVFSDVYEAATWLASHSSLSPSAILGALAQVTPRGAAKKAS